MSSFGLSDEAVELIRGVFRKHPEVSDVRVFGSRAKGNAQPQSDIDLAIWGHISTRILASIMAELEELPLPYRFDVQPYERIKNPELREHIDRVGKTFFSQRIALPQNI